MPDIAAIYNTLPSVQATSNTFTDREATFAKLAPLFAKYNNTYGICLVHAHTKLAASEWISKPVRVQAPAAVYPERWLTTGQACEFSSRAAAARVLCGVQGDCGAGRAAGRVLL